MTKNIAYLVLFISFCVMSWFIVTQVKRNRKSSLSKYEPKIAGDDLIIGTAKNPQQFDEPDEDALDEMAMLLEDS